MTPPTKRPVGRPRKVAKPENPDCEPATKGYVKYLMRKYHEQQTVKNMEHRQGSVGILTAVAWIIFGLLFATAWYLTDAVYFGSAAICSALLFINSISVGVGYSDTIRCASENTDFMQKHTPPRCEEKREREE